VQLQSHKVISENFPFAELASEIFFLFLVIVVSFTVSYFLVELFPSTDSFFLGWIAVPCAIPKLVVLDSFLPWFPVLCLGIFLSEKKMAKEILIPTIVACGATFILVRCLYVFKTGFEFGNYRPILEALSGYSFFGMSKYPPDVAFITFWLSICLIMLLVLGQIPEYIFRQFPLKQLSFLGSAPLFFYVLHLFLCTLLSLPFKEGTTSLLGIYLEWVVVIILSYYPTKFYAKFKLTKHKDSWWRLF